MFFDNCFQYFWTPKKICWSWKKFQVHHSRIIAGEKPKNRFFAGFEFVLLSDFFKSTLFWKSNKNNLGWHKSRRGESKIEREFIFEKSKKCSKMAIFAHFSPNSKNRPFSLKSSKTSTIIIRFHSIFGMLESTVQRWVFEYEKIASLNMSDNITGFFRKTGFSNLFLSQIFDLNAPREREEKLHLIDALRPCAIELVGKNKRFTFADIIGFMTSAFFQSLKMTN